VVSLVALDTNAVSALFDGQPPLLQVLEGVTRLVLPVIVIGEYRFGLQRSRDRRRLGALLDSLIADSEVAVVDPETARFYAEVRENLRARGKPLPENDVWIAALCRQHDLCLVTRDAHFSHVEALSQLTW
jgi:predicted nucleic acid-binding protein